MLENSNKSIQVKQEGKGITINLIGGNTKEVKDQAIKHIKKQAEPAKNSIKDQRQAGLDLVSAVKEIYVFLSKSFCQDRSDTNHQP